MNSPKKFRFNDSDLKPLAMGRGSCFASDLITVDGYKVGFLYREAPEFDGDSGWRFLAGFETDVFLDNGDHFSRFDVNWIANCDPEIVEYLDKPIGSAFGRNPAQKNRFVEVREE